MEKEKAVAAATNETVRRSELESLPTLYKLELFSAVVIALPAVYWTFNGDPILGALVGFISLILIYNFFSQTYSLLWRLPYPSIYYMIAAVLVIGIHHYGVAGAIWAIPLATAAFYVFPARHALRFNAVCLLMILTQIYLSHEYILGFRIAGALIVSSALTHFFSTLISQQKRDLARLSIIDPLTGTFNRLYLQQRLTEIVEQRDTVNTLVLLDVNNFKYINTNYGHDGGDKALVKMIEVFNAYTSEKTPLYRYGGDEFIVIYENTCIEKAQQHIELIAAALRKISRQPHHIPISFSAGYANTADYNTTEEILTACDKSMFEQKANKSHIFFKPNEVKA